MKAYHFDNEGFYQGKSDAFPNPLEQGEFLLPAHSTFVAPPIAQLPEGQNYQWDGNSWDVAVDPKWIQQKEVEARMNEQARTSTPVVFFNPAQDNKIVSATSLSVAAVSPESNEVNAPAGLSALVLEEGDTLPNLYNDRGVPLFKVVNSEIVPRSASLITAETTEVDWARLREERDRRIAATDYTQMPDYPISPELKAEYTAYRQALRDLPQNTTDPLNPTWPVAPTE